MPFLATSASQFSPLFWTIDFEGGVPFCIRVRVRSTFSNPNLKKRPKTTSRKNKQKCIFRNLKIAKMPIYVGPERFSVEPESKEKRFIFRSRRPSFWKTKNRQNHCIHSVLDHFSIQNRCMENVIKKHRVERPNALKQRYL